MFKVVRHVETGHAVEGRLSFRSLRKHRREELRPNRQDGLVTLEASYYCRSTRLRRAGARADDNVAVVEPEILDGNKLQQRPVGVHVG